jgi:hypothetical protein
VNVIFLGKLLSMCLFVILDHKHGHKRNSFLSLFGSGTFDPMGALS